MSAACGSPRVDATMFDYDRPGETNRQARDRHERAAAVCAGCSIRDACVLEASRRKASGVFGGALYVDGKRVRRLRHPEEPQDQGHAAVVAAAESRLRQLALESF